MKILWVNSNFMHPTNKGGSIRTLEMLRHLHERHEIHYAAIEQPRYAEGPARAGEYSTRSYSVRVAGGPGARVVPSAQHEALREPASRPVVGRFDAPRAL